MTAAIISTVIVCVICAFIVLMIAALVQKLSYWKLVCIMHKEHPEEWRREGEPYNFLLEGRTGGGFKAEANLLSKLLYSPPAWITTSEKLNRIYKRMCFMDRIMKRILIALILIVLLDAFWLAMINGRMMKGEQVGAGQPATRPESKSEGSDKHQPVAEGRSR